MTLFPYTTLFRVIVLLPAGVFKVVLPVEVVVNNAVGELPEWVKVLVVVMVVLSVTAVVIPSMHRPLT